MQTKLQELTDKIYQEGVNKAREEADKLLANAQKEADDIVSKARKKAEDMEKEADRKAQELQKNSLNELQLSARQMMEDTQQKIVKLIEAEVIDPQVQKAFSDVEFTREVILTLVKNWNPQEAADLKVLLPQEKQKQFEEFFTRKTAEKLAQGLEIAFSDKIKGGFKIGPKEGGYMISFSQDDFENYFKGYMRPRLEELLYKK